MRNKEGSPCSQQKDVLCQVGLGNGGLNMEALDADGNVLEPFQESEYEIIGIYSYPVVPYQRSSCVRE